MISADNAHAWHPNYAEKYDPTNHPMLGGGPVIKFNAAQKYASDAASAAVFAGICEKAGVPCHALSTIVMWRAAVLLATYLPRQYLCVA